MLLKSKLYCHWDLVRFVEEEHLIDNDGKNLTLSVTEGKKVEFMIFLEKEESTSNYEVRVYKASADNNYIPNELDNVFRYEENDEYATFFFVDF